ncbi:MAG: hypothetical protein ACT4OD_06645 [Candidatus Nitrosotenuis sp.]
MKNRRGISEIISAMVIIAVVASGLGLYTALSQQRILGETQSVKDAMESSENQLAEMIENIIMLKKDDEVHAFVHNYGLKNITITSLYVNGTNNPTTIPHHTYVKSLTSANLSSVIPLGASEIILNFTGNSIPLKNIDSIVIRTDSNKIIELQNGTN